MSYRASLENVQKVQASSLDEFEANRPLADGNPRKPNFARCHA
jgi:hypothetical protein